MKADEMGFDVERIRKDFPILERKVNGKKLVYLDNAATTQKPGQVIRAVSEYYEKYNANIHRGVHTLSQEASKAYENAHEKTAKFIGAKSMEEIVFTRNATESLNLLAYSLLRNAERGKEIVLTKMEHHSNLVPWQQIAMQKGLKLKFLGLDEKGRLDISGAEKIISDKTAIVGAIHASNITGYINPVKELAEISHEHNALFVLDGAQSVPHFPVNVKKLDCDFLAFSGHKMLAPAGIGGLYGKRELLEKMEPFLYGGDMIFEVWLEKSTWNKLPWKFEAGTPAIADGIGLGSAIDYLEKIGMENVRTWEKKLVDKTFGEMRGIGEIEIYGENEKERGGVIAFNVKGLHPHDVATILDREGIAIRSGEHCAQPYMRELGIEAGTARASFYIYNTPEEIELLCAGIAKAKKLVS